MNFTMHAMSYHHNRFWNQYGSNHHNNNIQVRRNPFTILFWCEHTFEVLTTHMTTLLSRTASFDNSSHVLKFRVAVAVSILCCLKPIARSISDITYVLNLHYPFMSGCGIQSRYLSLHFTFRYISFWSAFFFFYKYKKTIKIEG